MPRRNFWYRKTRRAVAALESVTAIEIAKDYAYQIVAPLQHAQLRYEVISNEYIVVEQQHVIEIAVANLFEQKRYMLSVHARIPIYVTAMYVPIDLVYQMHAGDPAQVIEDRSVLAIITVVEMETHVDLQVVPGEGPYQ
jgi:hypothetical protein